MALLKTFLVRERYRIQFRVESFNLTNTPRFDSPGTSLGSATFGVVSAVTVNWTDAKGGHQVVMQYFAQDEAVRLDPDLTIYETLSSGSPVYFARVAPSFFQ